MSYRVNTVLQPRQRTTQLEDSAKLPTTADVAQGSMISSEKSNVKLPSGTLILLRVNPER